MEGALPQPAGSAPSVQTRALWGFFAAGACGGSWLAAVLCKAVCSCSVPSLCCWTGLFPPCRTLHFSLLTFVTLVSLFLQPAESREGFAESDLCQPLG